VSVPAAGAPIPFIDLAAGQAELEPELAAAVARVLDSAWYLLGPELEAFEREFAAYCEVEHCVGVGSGMSALELALRALGIGPGDEVIVPGYTWVATWLAVTQVGATPVPVDVEAATYNLDPEAMRAAIGPRTAAVIPVHLRGEPAAMEPIAELAEAHGLAVLEDAAQAHGARSGGRRVGGLGAAGAFSFYPAKNLGALGDGGAVTTNDAGLADKVRLLRNYGMRDRYEVEAAGVNSRLAEVSAAALRVKLAHLDDWNERRRARAADYLAALAEVPDLTVPEPLAGTEPVWHLFAVGHQRREAAREALAAAGISTLVHYPLLPGTSGAYRDDPRIAGADLPVSARLAAEELTLPMYPQLPADAAARTAAALRALV
jgi:dTDP-4-amino-4,6-dideoxygalactose transaminase